MKNYVQGKDRGPSPQPGQLTKPNRATVAANAKITKLKTVLSHDDQNSEHIRSRGLNTTRQNQPLTQHQQSQHRRQGQGHDTYDTDAASLDTTQPRGSYVQSRHEQVEDHHDETGDEYDENDEDGDDQSDDEDHDPPPDSFQGENAEQFPGQQQLEIMQNYTPEVRQETLARTGQAGMFDGNNSYPTTTSGVPDDYNLGHEYTSDNFDDQRVVSPSPARQIFKVQQQPLQQTGPLHHPSYGNRNPVQVANARATIPMRGAMPIFPSTAPITTAPSLNTFPHQHAPVPAGPPVPQRVVRQPQDPSGTQESQSHGKRPRVVNEMLPQMHREPPPTLNTPEGAIDDVPATAGVIVDYDAEELHKMDYARLRQEDFDTVPRGESSVLSEDMQKKPLAERLEHVHKSMNESDQAKFLGSLPTTEWEDAGDWFLEQFSSIIKRTKESRQSKRKLAIKFEEEVDKHHQHVAKKQNTVTESLLKMQNHGRGLLPKSPRKG